MFKPVVEPPEGASIRKALRSPLRFLTFSLPPEVTASARSASSCVTGAAGGGGVGGGLGLLHTYSFLSILSLLIPLREPSALRCSSSPIPIESTLFSTGGGGGAGFAGLILGAEKHIHWFLQNVVLLITELFNQSPYQFSSAYIYPYLSFTHGD